MTDKKTAALKLALEALEEISNQYMSLTKKGCMALAAIEEALASEAPEQPAPVPKAHEQQEPVAVARVDDLERGGRVRALAMNLSLDAPLYTTQPPRKPWVGLTDEERADVYKSIHAKDFCVSAVAIAIEAKLKEKNT